LFSNAHPSIETLKQEVINQDRDLEIKWRTDQDKVALVGPSPPYPPALVRTLLTVPCYILIAIQAAVP
jgi:hypothetical protein